jgi:hypothetical protein
MDANEYLYERILNDRLTEARTRAATERLLAAARPPRRAIRHVVGNAFIELGHWLLVDTHGSGHDVVPPPRGRLGAV